MPRTTQIAAALYCSLSVIMQIPLSGLSPTRILLIFHLSWATTAWRGGLHQARTGTIILRKLLKAI